MSTTDTDATTAAEDAAEGAGDAPTPAPPGVPENAAVSPERDAISNERIMYGEGGAPAPAPAENPRNPYADLVEDDPEETETTPEALARPDPYLPITMDLLVPRRVDVMIGHGSYEMRTLDEFGSASKTRFFQLWNQAEEVVAGSRGVVVEPVKDELTGAVLNQPEIDAARELVAMWGKDLAKADDQIDDLYRRILELAMPTLPKKLLRGRIEKGRLTSGQVATLVNRFLVLIGEEPVVLEPVARTPTNVTPLLINR